MQGPEPSSAQRRWNVFGWTILALGVALAVGLLALVAVSSVPMRGAEMFGALVNKIKGYPGATAAVAVGGGAALWLGVAILAAGQESLASRRRTP
jgi:hypothetical protein